MRKIEIKSKSLNYECDEAFKALRTNLQFAVRIKKVIMFHELYSGRGKKYGRALSCYVTGKYGKEGSSDRCRSQKVSHGGQL